MNDRPPEKIDFSGYVLSTGYPQAVIVAGFAEADNANANDTQPGTLGRTILALLFLISALMLTACGGGSSFNNTHAPQLRVLHLSPDAPFVDVEIDGAAALEDVAYRQGSGFLAQSQGPLTLKVLAANTTTAVIDATLDLVTDTRYTVMAINQLSQIEPLVIEDDNVPPATGFSGLRVVHAAASVGLVDLYVTNPGANLNNQAPLLEDVPFRAVSDEIEVPAGDYRVRLTPANSQQTVYDSGLISLTSGVRYIAAASENPLGASPVALTILTDLESTPVVAVDDARARVRVVHASADAPAVNVAVDGSDVLQNVSFANGSGYLALEAGTYNIDVSASGNSQSVINADLDFMAREDYTVAAVNTLSAIEALILEDDNTPPASGNVKVRLVHAAQSAGLVDVYITAPSDSIDSIAPSIEDFAFTQNSGYLEVPAGDYRVRITVASTKTIALDTGTLALQAGQIRTAFALDPAPGNSNFGVLLLEDADY